MSMRGKHRAAEPLRRLSVGEIRRRVLVERQPVAETALRVLRSDPRRGVQDICRRLERLVDRERAEWGRVGAMLAYERRLWKTGVLRVAGVDEAGVGPLAGPVVAAAVIVLPGHDPLSGVDDSKRLSADARGELASLIRAGAGVGVGVAEVGEIEKLNIYHAGLLAMRRAVVSLDPLPEHLLVDGRTLPGWGPGQTRVAGGDRLSYSIAAASIIAKTHRDALMVEIDRLYPRYGFAEHKGYPTPAHQAALARHGPCPLHRRGFAAVSEFAGGFSPRFYAFREELRTADSVERIATLRQRVRRSRSELTGPEKKRLVALTSSRLAAMPDRAAVADAAALSSSRPSR
jgi:ribonuclease HII